MKTTHMNGRTSEHQFPMPFAVGLFLVLALLLTGSIVTVTTFASEQEAGGLKTLRIKDLGRR